MYLTSNVGINVSNVIIVLILTVIDGAEIVHNVK